MLTTCPVTGHTRHLHQPFRVQR